MTSPAENKSPNAKDHASSPITEASLDIDCLVVSGFDDGGGGVGETTPTHKPRSRKRSAPEADADDALLQTIFPDTAPNSRTLPSSHRALAYPASSNDSQQQQIDIEEEEEYDNYDEDDDEEEEEEDDCMPSQEVACNDSLLMSLTGDDDNNDSSTNSNNKYISKSSSPTDTDHPTAAFFDDLAARGSIYRFIVQK